MSNNDPIKLKQIIRNITAYKVIISIIFGLLGLLHSDSVRSFLKLPKSTADPRLFYIYTNAVILSGILIFSFAGEKYIWGLWDSDFQGAARILGSILILMAGILCTYGVANVFVKRQREELIETEEELQKNEKKLSQIIEGSPIPTFVLDNEHKITHWNKACENLTGASISEMVGTKNTWKPFYLTKRPVMADVIVDELSEEEIAEYYGGKYQKSTIIEETYEVEDFFPGLGDSGKWLFFTATALRDDQGGIIGAIETFQDISERRRLEDRMVHLNLVLRAIRNINQLITKEKDRNRLLRSSCNNLIETRGYHNAWIALLDESGRFVTTAQAGLGDIFELMIERLKQGKLIECAQKALKKSEVIIIDDPVSTCTDCPLVEQYEGRRAMTIRLEHEGNVYGLFSVAVPAVLAADNQEQDLFKEVAEDIAFALYSIELERERKKTEEELKETVANLKRSNSELEQFAYVASHDLQEPLRMISSYVQLLARRYEGKLDQDADDFIGYAVDGAKRMQVLINDLLIFSRVSTRGKTFKPINCESILGQVLTNLKMAIEDSYAMITHDSLPTIMADGSQLTQLLQNLISNAIKFRSDDPPRIHISAERKEIEWEFSVADNGIGIKPEFFDRIFVIFQRLHGREEYSGTGIGLSVCKKIVERHGGRIWVESEPGEGTTFFFTMPIERGE